MSFEKGLHCNERWLMSTLWITETGNLLAAQYHAGDTTLSKVKLGLYICLC